MSPRSPHHVAGAPAALDTAHSGGGTILKVGGPVWQGPRNVFKRMCVCGGGGGGAEHMIYLEG